MTELQKVEFEILKEFVRVCNELNLTYFLVCGSALGAAKYGGFIPWDDDIDVGMPRDDYEVFLQRAQELLPEKYFVQSFKTDIEWSANFTKIRNCETTFIETSVKKRKINHGVYIDIFPLDWHEDNKYKLKNFNFKNKLYQAAIAKSFYFERSKRNWKWYAIRLLTFFIPVKTALRKREKLLKSNKGRLYLANYCGAWGSKEIVPYSWYGNGVELEFEGLKVRAPQEYDKWLTNVYGDYMQLPPKEKRISHHYTEVIDFSKSYKEYINKGVL